jgi:hypothetical protein
MMHVLFYDRRRIFFSYLKTLSTSGMFLEAIAGSPDGNLQRRPNRGILCWPPQYQGGMSMNSPSTAVYLRPSEVAIIVRKDPTTIRRWIKAGYLPAIRLPGHPDKANYLIRREDLEKLLQFPSQDTEPAESPA